MAQFYNHDTELQSPSQPDWGDRIGEAHLNSAELIDPTAMERCLNVINYIINTYGSGLLNEQSYELPRLRVAELAIGRHEVEGVHPKSMPYAHFEVPIGEFADRADWNAVAIFNYGDAKLTNCVTWFKDGSIKATWYGSEAASMYLTNDMANALASDLESMGQETDQSYQDLLAPTDK